MVDVPGQVCIIIAALHSVSFDPFDVMHPRSWAD